jgi:hypothetical protein
LRGSVFHSVSFPGGVFCNASRLEAMLEDAITMRKHSPKDQDSLLTFIEKNGDRFGFGDR